MMIAIECVLGPLRRFGVAPEVVALLLSITITTIPVLAGFVNQVVERHGWSFFNSVAGVLRRAFLQEGLQAFLEIFGLGAKHLLAIFHGHDGL